MRPADFKRKKIRQMWDRGRFDYRCPKCQQIFQSKLEWWEVVCPGCFYKGPKEFKYVTNRR